MTITGKEKPYKGKEDDLQTSCAKYIRFKYKDVLWMHVPNGGSRNIVEAKKLKAMGVRAGVSDLLFLEPRGEWAGLVIELKVAGGQPSATQRKFLKDCDKRRYKVYLCYSLDAFMSIVDQYFK